MRPYKVEINAVGAKTSTVILGKHKEAYDNLSGRITLLERELNNLPRVLLKEIGIWFGDRFRDPKCKYFTETWVLDAISHERNMILQFHAESNPTRHLHKDIRYVIDKMIML